MPAVVRILLLISLLVIYGFGYSRLDSNMQERPATLQAVPPLKLLQAISGYFRQINSEMMFVQTSVFLGGLKPGADESEYEESLANNLRTITSLYPEFKDPYFHTNAFLAPISKYGAEQTSLIFKTGIKALPNDFILRFFDGANYFYNLEQANKAADAFAQAAELEDAPPIFAHLAAVFSGHGGNLKAGLVMLHTMLKTEDDEIVRERYLEEIACFEQAIVIQNAVNEYIRDKGHPPEKLSQLVPEYISEPLDYLNEMPDYIKTPSKLEKRFILVYEPPTVSLRRPDPKQNKKNK